MTKTVHVVSLGCPKARVDTEVMIARMLAAGYTLTPAPELADAIVVNTCSFLQSAVDESVDTILEMASFKQDGRCENLVVTGCLPSRYKDDLVVELPEVDHFLGTSDLHRIGDALNRTLPERSYIQEGSYLYEDGVDARYHSTQGASAYLKLAEGCNRTCSFCIIPDIRGKQRSRQIPELVGEARLLASQGIKEIVLVAQDLTSYGVDLRKGATEASGLVPLLDALHDVSGIAWLRLMYCYPWNFSDELIDVLRTSDKVVRYVDMPLQHISARILEDMRRNIQREKQRELLSRLREIDGMVLRTTFITGFPGETDSEFQELLDWVEEVRFDRVGVFPFSPEPGTLAATMPDQVPQDVAFARRDAIMELQQRIHEEKLQALMGQTLRVLVDGPSEEHPLVYEGRYYGQAPEIDGVVYLSFEDGGPMVMSGDFVDVVIEDSSAYDLVGIVETSDAS